MNKLFPAALGVCVCLLAAAVVRAADPPEEYEMTTYQVAFLKKGPAWTPGESPELKALQEAHMENIRRMGATGKLLIAGPFEADGDLRGMFIFRASPEEARALAEQDPAVRAGRLKLEWHSWFAAKNVTVTAKAPPAPR
jgi:uncharacterized protein YciI